MVARRSRLEAREDLVQRVLTNALLALGRDLEPLGSALDLAGLLEQLLEVGDPEALVEEPVLLAEVLHPAQGFLDVAAGLEQEVPVDVHQLLDELDVFGPRALPFRVVEAHGANAQLRQ